MKYKNLDAQLQGTMFEYHPPLIQAAIDGDDGPNVKRNERNGEDNGQRKEQDKHRTVPKLHEDLLNLEGEDAVDE